MKKIISLSVFFFTFFISYSQTKISIDSVNNYFGKKITVCAAVYGIKSTEKVTFINLGKPYPSSPLTLVIFAKDRINFSDTPEKLYGNKPICVTGTIKEYKGKAEIIVNMPGDITVQ